MADFLAVIDSDITQAIQVSTDFPPVLLDSTDCYPMQSCKEEHQAGRLGDISSARELKNDLRNALNESLADVKTWGGEFAFERTLLSMDYWKL